MSHPFAEEKLWSHRVFVSFARALAERGYPVLRFDYMGAGDSSGTTPETSLQTHLDDLRAAVEVLLARQPQLERVGVVGLRLGATFAALFCEEVVARSEYEQLRTGPLVLWDPLMDGESYFQELLRSNLTTQLAVYGEVREDREALRERIRAGGAVNVDGYELGNALFESCATRALLSTESKRHAGPVLVVQIATTDQSKDRTDLQALAQSYSRGTFLRSKEQTFWREIKPFYGRAHDLQKTTLAWMDKHRV